MRVRAIILNIFGFKVRAHASMPATSASVVLHPVIEFPLKVLKTGPENKRGYQLSSAEIINNCDQRSNETLAHSPSSSSYTSSPSSRSDRSYTYLKSTSEESLLSSGMYSSSSTASCLSLLPLSAPASAHSLRPTCNWSSTSPTVSHRLRTLQLRLVETETRIVQLHNRCTDRISHLSTEAFRHTEDLHQASWRCFDCTPSRPA
jgi:hypothetical protein